MVGVPLGAVSLLAQFTPLPPGQSDPSPRISPDEALAPHIYVFYAAFLVAFIFTPVLRFVALYYGIIDRPDNVRKMHSAPIAYLGGVAVFLGWLSGLAVSQLHIAGIDPGVQMQLKISIVVGAIFIVVLGLWDDVKHVRPRSKIIGQAVAAGFLLVQGVGLHCMDPVLSPINLRLEHLGYHALPPWVSMVISCIVVLCVVIGCTNATNLMDGLDGLCGGVTAIIAAGFLFLAVHLATLKLEPEWDGVRIVLALSLLGAILGFVPYNFNPASIFMGDTGSMFLGYACANMIILLAQQQSKWFLAAMVMFALPILDTSLAFARRFVNRRPLFSADRFHFHHQLVARGLSVRKAVLVSYSLAVGFCALGALIVFMRTRYAIAFYLVIFGSIIVAAYKMGMVHEKPRVVGPGGALQGIDPESVAVDISSETTLEVRVDPLKPSVADPLAAITALARQPETLTAPANGVPQPGLAPAPTSKPKELKVG
jgi:UDP-GlcNAc:undecaprenyl-phosphate GlcNAc-1-phosphate transferase